MASEQRPETRVVNVRLAAELVARLVKLAKINRRTIVSEVSIALEQYLDTAHPAVTVGKDHSALMPAAA